MPSTPVDFLKVSENVSNIRHLIQSAGGDKVQLIAVTKGFGVDAIAAATLAKCDGIGENYAQEIMQKYAKDGTFLGEKWQRLPVHFVGKLQSNKIGGLLGVVDCWQTIDRLSVIKELSKSGQVQQVFVQVNSTGEPSKGGCAPHGVEKLCTMATEAGLVVVGLMTMGPTNGSIQVCETAFKGVRTLADSLGLIHCSMGMSDDFECAVGCGSTMVRVGSGIFGARPTLGSTVEIT
ncbi:MAG: hypothetical protein EXQ63_04040 [Ilumatobacteraceae bacterium]|nr:hypothetical protein [Ilumatobacteraceae bacterium]